MTPQASRTSAQPRYSLGSEGPATGPRRVRVVEPWKVTDLVVPMDSIKDEEAEEDNVSASTKDVGGSAGGNVSGTPDRKKLSEEERQVSVSTLFSSSTGMYVCGFRLTNIIVLHYRRSCRGDGPHLPRPIHSYQEHVGPLFSPPLLRSPHFLSRPPLLPLPQDPLQLRVVQRRAQRKTQGSY